MPNRTGLTVASWGAEGLGEERGEVVVDDAAVDRGRSSNLRRDSCGVGGVELLAVVTND